MKKLLEWTMVALLAATLAPPVLAQDSEPKPTAKAKAKPAPKPAAKADEAAERAEAERKSSVLNDRLRRGAESDQKDRARGTGASSGATSSTPAAPSGVDTTR